MLCIHLQVWLGVFWVISQCRYLLSLASSKSHALLLSFVTMDFCQAQFLPSIFFNIFYWFFTERKREGQRVRNVDERETSTSCLLHTPHWGCARNQGTCPWPESNPGPFSLQADALSTEPNIPYTLISAIHEGEKNILFIIQNHKA